jgi:phage terminase large subunit
MQIQMTVNEKIWKFLNSTTSQINLIWGGTGGGKSYTMMQWFLMKLLSDEKIILLILRKIRAVCRRTVFEPFLRLCRDYRLEKVLKIHTTYMQVRYGQNLLYFEGLDDPEKIKGFEANYIWIEEATDLERDDFLQLLLRLQRTQSNPKIFLTFNPLQFHWIFEEFFQKKSYNYQDIHVTFQDNPFLSNQFVEKLHSLRNIDITFWKIYTQGEWAQPQELIFQNWKVTKDSTFWYRGEKEIVYGLDFGFVYPTALIRIEWDRRDNLFLAEEIYETKLTNSELITLMKARNIPNNIPIYADPEDPGRIQEIAEAGFNIQPAIRATPKEGIRYLQEFNLYIPSQAGNILKEIQTYSWRTDRQGNILEQPVKFNDHAMDAIRYAVYTWHPLSQKRENQNDMPLEVYGIAFESDGL